jgi:hypothetical protein
MPFEPIHGGCQCGAVRYTLTAPPREVLHCHCSMCRKANGALFVSSGRYDTGQVRFDRGGDAMRAYESSPGTDRVFCPACGCQLLNRIAGMSDSLFVMLGTLDLGALPGHDPAVERHIYWDSRVHWYDVGNDGLARSDGYSPT